MNRILDGLVARVVAGEMTAAEAMEAAWQSGIQEGKARQKVEDITGGSSCTPAERKVLDAMDDIPEDGLRAGIEAAKSTRNPHIVKMGIALSAQLERLKDRA